MTAKEFEKEYYECLENFRLLRNSTTTAERSRYASKIISARRRCPELKKVIEYHPSNHRFTHRFFFDSEAFERVKMTMERKETMTFPPQRTQAQIKTIEKFEDGINYEAPTYAGLYFIGETHFNPLTHEEFYWVKIGKAVDLAQRMREYNTHCPMLWRIDFSRDYYNEAYYHQRLKEICIASCNHNREWFLVDKETYFNMCELGFRYF